MIYDIELKGGESAYLAISLHDAIVVNNEIAKVKKVELKFQKILKSKRETEI